MKSNGAKTWAMAMATSLIVAISGFGAAWLIPGVSGAATSGVTNATYDAQDRLLQYGNATYIYTTNGELQSRTVGAQTTSYTYDAMGNLTRVVLPSGAQIDYLIDGQERRVGKRVNGALTKGFLYQSGLQIIAELDATGSVTSRFVYARGRNVPDYMMRGGVTYRLITDQVGSVRLVVDAATGAVAQRLDYDEFGRVLADTNPGFQPFGFAGGLYDPDTGVVRFGARDYDAETGRWTAKDSIGFGGGQSNLYAYGNNDPPNATDSTGTKTYYPKESYQEFADKELSVIETQELQAILNLFADTADDPKYQGEYCSVFAWDFYQLAKAKLKLGRLRLSYASVGGHAWIVVSKGDRDLFVLDAVTINTSGQTNVAGRGNAHVWTADEFNRVILPIEQKRHIGGGEEISWIVLSTHLGNMSDKLLR